MKPITLDDHAKTILRDGVMAKFEEAFKQYQFNVNEAKFSVNFNLCFEAKEKINIIYSQKAYLRMRALVEWYDTEVAWYGLVEKRSPTEYYVYDVKVHKQYVNGAKVDTDDDEALEFFASLTDDEAAHMHFQAHSHVKMTTTASPVDLTNQADVVHNLGKEGFYIFQIWNKYMDINTYLYDLNENMFYDRKDIQVSIEDEMGTTDDFVASTLDLVVEKKTVQNYSSYQGRWPNQPQQTYQSTPGQSQSVIWDERGDWDR